MYAKQIRSVIMFNSRSHHFSPTDGRRLLRDSHEVQQALEKSLVYSRPSSRPADKSEDMIVVGLIRLRGFEAVDGC